MQQIKPTYYAISIKRRKKISLHATKVLRQRLKDLCRSLYLSNISQDPDHHAKHGIALIICQNHTMATHSSA